MLDTVFEDTNTNVIGIVSSTALASTALASRGSAAHFISYIKDDDWYKVDALSSPTSPSFEKIKIAAEIIKEDICPPADTSDSKLALVYKFLVDESPDLKLGIEAREASINAIIAAEKLVANELVRDEDPSGGSDLNVPKELEDAKKILEDINALIGKSDDLTEKNNELIGEIEKITTTTNTNNEISQVLNKVSETLILFVRKSLPLNIIHDDIQRILTKIKGISNEMKEQKEQEYSASVHDIYTALFEAIFYYKYNQYDNNVYFSSKDEADQALRGVIEGAIEAFNAYRTYTNAKYRLTQENKKLKDAQIEGAKKEIEVQIEGAQKELQVQNSNLKTVFDNLNEVITNVEKFLKEMESKFGKEKSVDEFDADKMGGGERGQKSKTLKRRKQKKNKSHRRFAYGGRKAYDQRKKKRQQDKQHKQQN